MVEAGPAPQVSSLLTAIPSIAARTASGTEYVAKRGRAVILPIDSSRGTSQAMRLDGNSRESIPSTSSRDLTERYRFTRGSPPPGLPLQGLQPLKEP